MRKITFDEEELFAIAVFEPGNRKETAERMSGVLEELTEDPDMRALIVSASEKLKRISDREFEELAIDGYREELAWEEEEEEDEGKDPEASPNSEGTGEGKRGDASASDERQSDDGLHDAASVTSQNAADAAPEPEKEGAQEKDRAGGGT